jgi:S-layer protein (TIGR01567 family)
VGADGKIEGEKILSKPEADGKETTQNSILETISSSIKSSSAASMRKPTSIDRGTDKDTSSDKITSSYSDKSASLDLSAKPLVVFSQAATGDFEWNPQNFAGFYYDLNSNTGAEVMTATLTNGKLSGSDPYGLVYQTTVQQKDFAFGDWGSYSVVGLLGEKYFAGYLDTAGSIEERLFEESGDANALSANKLLRVLIDDDHEKTITTATPLELEDGYTLAIDSIDISSNTVTMILSKDGKRLSTKKIFPSRDGATMADKTFIFRKNFGNLRDVIIAAVHFKNAFRGADQDLATVDGIWQLSDETLDISVGTSLGKMTIQSVTSDGIAMNNEGSDLSLSRNKDISLMPSFGIRTADADSLRYCIYREITEPGTLRLRGAAADDSHSWTADSFAGFYYDLDDGIETESLRTSVTDGALEQPDGITYTTNAKKVNFKFEDWGSYKVIGFLGERCFAEYVSGEESLGKSSSNYKSAKGLLFDKSTDKSALAKKQLLKILADDDTEKTITTNSPLKLDEGYELSIKSISSDGNNVYLELSRNGEVVHSSIMYPSYDAAATAENTYIYKGDSGELKNVVLIAVHFKNAFRGSDQNLATVDGIWQLSKSPISVKEMTSFGKLTISDITGSQISMRNRENPIKLSRNKYVSLAGDIYLQTADSNLLRYYIVREIER